jgi:predicted metal-dependent phosphoesterase TrpH
MVVIDLHVHTRRYSPCAELLDPDGLGDCMEKAGVQGVVITEHDVLWARDELAELNRQMAPCRVYRGVEVSTAEGHVVVIGIDRSDTIWPGMPVGELARIVAAQQAIAIWAHPPSRSIREPLEASVRRMAAAIDAIEIFSTVTTSGKSRAARAFARKHQLTEVAGSDAHYPEQVGVVGTVFKTMPADEKTLAQMIKRGEGHPRRLDGAGPDWMPHVA